MWKPADRSAAIDRILFALKKGHALKAACGFAGVPRRTFSEWCAANQALGDQVEIARGKGQHMLEELAFDREVTGPQASILRGRLAASDPSEWGDVRVAIDGGSLTLTDLAKADVAAGQ